MYLTLKQNSEKLNLYFSNFLLCVVVLRVVWSEEGPPAACVTIFQPPLLLEQWVISHIVPLEKLQCIKNAMVDSVEMAQKVCLKSH